MTAWASEPDNAQLSEEQARYYLSEPNGDFRLTMGLINLAGWLLNRLSHQTDQDMLSILQEWAAGPDVK